MQRTLQWAEHIQCEPPTIPASSDGLPAEAEPEPETAGARGGVQATQPPTGVRAPVVATEYNHYEVPERDLVSGPLWLLGGGSSIGTPSTGMAGRESALRRMGSGLACGGRDPRHQQLQQAPRTWDIQVHNSLQGQMLLHAALFSSHALMFSHFPLHTLSIHFIIPF